MLRARVRCTLALVILTSLSVPLVSQDRQMGGAGLTVYSDTNFRGRNEHAESDIIRQTVERGRWWRRGPCEPSVNHRVNPRVNHRVNPCSSH
jgi:hypothetical protein